MFYSLDSSHDNHCVLVCPASLSLYVLLFEDNDCCDKSTELPRDDQRDSSRTCKRSSAAALWANTQVGKPFVTQHSACILGPVHTYPDISSKMVNRSHMRRSETKMAANSLIFASLCLSQGACARNLCMLTMSKPCILQLCLCMLVDVQI